MASTSSFLSEKVKHGVVFIFIAFLGFYYNYKYLNDFPNHIHAWTQADRYALAVGFANNGLNFFKPETFVYKTYDWRGSDTSKSEKNTTITAVDFPIHDYIPGAIMKITGNNSPLVFRLYILFYSFLGLFFLFKLSFTITENFEKSLFVVVFAATSPVFVYYQAGFLPTIPSFSNAVIGFYFFVRYWKKEKNKYFVWSFVFLTLAALARTTFVIPFIAVGFMALFRFAKNRKIEWKLLLTMVFSALFILFYFFYNRYLANEYGSIFLGNLTPAESFEQIKQILKETYTNWFFEYFSGVHYVVFLLIFVCFLYFSGRKKLKWNNVQKMLGLLTAVYFFGCFLFIIAMIVQYREHDYYFLDTFFFPALLFLLLLLSLLKFPKISFLRKEILILFLLIASLLVAQPLETQETRRLTGYWDKMQATIENFDGSDEFLDELGVSENAKILVLDAVATNVPFLKMNRKGYAVLYPIRENIEAAFLNDFDYIVLQNNYFSSGVYAVYPEILYKMKRINDNGKITVYRKEKNNPSSFLAFFGMENLQPIFSVVTAFEEGEKEEWGNANKTTENVFSGEYSGHLTTEMSFGLSYETAEVFEQQHQPKALYIEGKFFKSMPVNCELTVKINDKDGNMLYYASQNINALLHKENEWKTISFIHYLPPHNADFHSLHFYLWNIGGTELFYDEVSFSVY